MRRAELSHRLRGGALPEPDASASSGRPRRSSSAGTSARAPAASATSRRGGPAPLDPAEPASLAAAVARDGPRARRPHVRRPRRPAGRRRGPLGGGRPSAEGVDAAAGRRGPHARLPGGSQRQIDLVADARPDVFNHNVETVPAALPDGAAEGGLRALRRPPRAREGAAPGDDDEVGADARPRRGGRRGPRGLPRAPGSGSRRRHGGAVPPPGRVEPSRRRVRDARALRGARARGMEMGFAAVSSPARSSGRATAPKNFLESEERMSLLRTLASGRRRTRGAASPLLPGP